LVLAGPTHQLAGATGPVAARELQGEEIVITGHRDGAAFDRAVAETLAELGVTPVLRRGRPGPALFTGVASGDALALTTSSAAAVGGTVARQVEPSRWVDFALLWHDEVPAPALQHFIDAAAAISAPGRPALQAVA
jgi:uridine phosphorylase